VTINKLFLKLQHTRVASPTSNPSYHWN